MRDEGGRGARRIGMNAVRREREKEREEEYDVLSGNGGFPF